MAAEHVDAVIEKHLEPSCGSTMQPVTTSTLATVTVKSTVEIVSK